MYQDAKGKGGGGDVTMVTFGLLRVLDCNSIRQESQGIVFSVCAYVLNASLTIGSIMPGSFSLFFDFTARDRLGA
jgi:hypothetical protein